MDITLLNYYQPFHSNITSAIASPKFIMLNLLVQYYVERINKL